MVRIKNKRKKSNKFFWLISFILIIVIIFNIYLIINEFNIKINIPIGSSKSEKNEYSNITNIEKKPKIPPNFPSDMSKYVYKPLNKTIEINNLSIKVYFCPEINCNDVFVNLTKKAKDLRCALYNLNYIPLVKIIKEKNSTLIIDDNYYRRLKRYNISMIWDKPSHLMHNKFCVIDNTTVITGSFNPVNNSKDNNNVLVIYSKEIAQNYIDEYNELLSRGWGLGFNVRYPSIKYKNGLIENYFCPEDKCANHIIKLLNSANDSIMFMTFSFTHPKIAEVLINKSKEISVKGIMEKSRIKNRWNVYRKFKGTNVKVYLDKNPHLMHNKVFIIDKKIVITGSFNPTKSADLSNDENILIIHNPKIAKLYIDEFYKLLK